MNDHENEPMADPADGRDPLFSDDDRNDDAASKELDAFQTLLSPLGDTVEGGTDFGQLLTQTAVRAEASRRRRRTFVRRLAVSVAAAILVTAVVRMFTDDSATVGPSSPRDTIACAPGTVFDQPGSYDLDGIVLQLGTDARARFEGIEDGRARFDVLGGEVRVRSEVACEVGTSAGEVRYDTGEVRVGSRTDRDIEIDVLDGEATFHSLDARLGDVETYLPETAQMRLFLGDDGSVRAGTPRLRETSQHLADLCEKFDYGERDAKTEDMLVRRIVDAAVSPEDTYVLWTLLARADRADEPRARRQLEARLIEIAGVPPVAQNSKISTFDVQAWLDHLRVGW